MNDEFELFNKIKNNKIIPFNFCFFAYVENKDFVYPSPINDYYFKINDISINNLISLKWASYSFFFFKSISTSMVEINLSKQNIYNILPKNSKNIFNYEKHTLYIDNFEINTIEDYIFVINNEYLNDIYNENTKIRFKLNLNLSDLILLQNYYIPTVYFLK